MELLNNAISVTGDTVVDKQASFVIEKSTRNSAAIPSVKKFYDKLLELVKRLGYKTLVCHISPVGGLDVIAAETAILLRDMKKDLGLNVVAVTPYKSSCDDIWKQRIEQLFCQCDDVIFYDKNGESSVDGFWLSLQYVLESGSVIVNLSDKRNAVSLFQSSEKQLYTCPLHNIDFCLPPSR